MIYNYSPKDRVAKRKKFFTGFRGGGVKKRQSGVDLYTIRACLVGSLIERLLYGNRKCYRPPEGWGNQAGC